MEIKDLNWILVKTRIKHQNTTVNMYSCNQNRMTRKPRRLAARIIWELQSIMECRPKSYNTVYNRLHWNEFTQSYTFVGVNDTYSFSILENI